MAGTCESAIVRTWKRNVGANIMMTHHYSYLPCSLDWFDCVDDFGNIVRLDESGKNRSQWWNAYRFANGQSFEQAGMRSIGQLVEEH